MKIVYFKALKGNLGDDLNEWLWPRIFGDLLKKGETVFFGIGTLLNDESPLIKENSDKRKIVFGTGVRPSESFVPFTVNELYDIKFLRGPYSSAALSDRYEYISDAAYALRQVKEFDQIIGQEKKYEVSVMPYFCSTEYFNWQEICEKLGYHYISPLCEKGVEYTLKEIASSKHLITEAMHGAIIADTLRVPWHRFVLSTPHREGPWISEFKWKDWLGSVEINDPETTFIPFYKKSKVHNWVKKLTLNMVSVEFFIKSYVSGNILRKLSIPVKYYLSDSSILSEIDARIAKKIKELILKNEE